MNPRYLAFPALSILSVFFLVPTGQSGTAASAALASTGVLSDVSTPIVESADSRPTLSDKSQPVESAAKREVVAAASAPVGTNATSGGISDAKRTLQPANVRPQVATENPSGVLSEVGMTGAGGDSSRAVLGCFCGLDTEGQDFCFRDEECALVRACTSSADCGSGERCLATNCCTAPLDFACFGACSGGCVGGGECNSYLACTTPPNDDCLFAQDVAVPSQVVDASTVGATFDAAPFCDTDNTAPGVWYRVMGTGNTMRASMCTEFVSLGYDPKISVYCGGCDVLTCVAGNDDGFCPGLPQFPSDVSWCSIAGAEYLVLMHGFEDTTGGAILNFSDDGNPSCGGRVSCVAGDDCGAANLIPSVPFSTTFDNSTALSDGPPGTCNSAAANAMDNDVWFSYKPGTDCELSVTVDPDASGVGYDGIAAVYRGPDCLNLTELACLDEPEPMVGNVSVTAGATYWIQMGDWGNFPGGGLTGLDVDCVPKSACCIQGDCVDGVPQDACLNQQGTWFDGVDCAGFTCPEACCSAAGGCSMAVPEACLEAGGLPQGAVSTCTSVNCPQPQEACCFPGGACDDMDPAGCVNSGGTTHAPPA